MSLLQFSHIFPFRSQSTERVTVQIFIGSVEFGLYFNKQYIEYEFKVKVVLIKRTF
jgi:hypothetical protein